MNILLVNPWITDFSAFDFRNKPLGLLYTGAFLKKRGHSIRLIDCMDRFQNGMGYDVLGRQRSFGTGKYNREIIEKPEILRHIPLKFSRYGIPVELFKKIALSGCKPDAVLVTCIMTYWYHGAFEAISLIHELYPGVPVILGGIYSALCHDHAVEKSGADAVIAESNPSKIIAAVESIGGETGSGETVTDDFALWPEPLWELYENLPSAVTMTSLGCPMRCTVCASHRLYDGFERRPPSDAVRSITELAGRGTADIAFCDDALLIDADKYALPMFDMLAGKDLNIRLHTPNGLHVREITSGLAKTMKKAGMVTIRLSLETASIERARDFSGKVTRDEFKRAVAILFKAGFSEKEIGAYILAGLPGQTETEVYETVDFVLDSGVTVKPALFSPVPGTVEFERAVGNGMIRVGDDPVLQNNTLRKFDIWGGDFRKYEKFRHKITAANKAITG